MKLVRHSAALFLFFFSLVTPSLAADWPPISPEDLSMTDVKEQPGAPAVILYREQTDDDLNGSPARELDLCPRMRFRVFAFHREN
jgi:hypothetical protein